MAVEIFFLIKYSQKRDNMTEKLFTGTLNKNQNKNKKQKRVLDVGVDLGVASREAALPTELPCPCSSNHLAAPTRLPQ